VTSFGLLPSHLYLWYSKEIPIQNQIIPNIVLSLKIFLETFEVEDFKSDNFISREFIIQGLATCGEIAEDPGERQFCFIIQK